MRYKVEDVLKFKHASDELINAAKAFWSGEDISNEDFEDLDFEGKHFSLIQIGKDGVTNNGKYEDGGEYWQLVEFKPTDTISYCDENNIVAKYDIQVYSGWYRSGSYFSDWTYEYDDAVYSRITLKDVPEVIIPAHKEVTITPCDFKEE